MRWSSNPTLNSKKGQNQYQIKYNLILFIFKKEKHCRMSFPVLVLERSWEEYIVSISFYQYLKKMKIQKLHKTSSTGPISATCLADYNH